jgi:hypothetical protein
MPTVSGSGESRKPLERIMGFIDGGYLRELCKTQCGRDYTDFDYLYGLFIYRFNSYRINQFNANIIRIYYYDAIVDAGHADYERQRKYFDSIADQHPFYTVRLGNLVKSSNTAYFLS